MSVVAHFVSVVALIDQSAYLTRGQWTHYSGRFLTLRRKSVVQNGTATSDNQVSGTLGGDHLAASHEGTSELRGIDMGPVRFVTCHSLHFGANWVCPVHRHEEGHELILVLRGGIRIRRGSDPVARAGDLLLYPQNLEHAPLSEGIEPLEGIVLHWSGGGYLANLDKEDECSDLHERIWRQLHWLLGLYPSHNPADQKMFDALTYTIVHELGQLQRSAMSSLAMRIRVYIRNHLPERITLNDLAHEAHMSKYHFSRTFRKITGQTPIAFVNQMRVQAARELLRESDLPLDAIAAMVGLADASHLSHLFRRLTGATPGSIRKGSSRNGTT